jgi:PAS domain S-box-containing protein
MVKRKITKYKMKSSKKIIKKEVKSFKGTESCKKAVAVCEKKGEKLVEKDRFMESFIQNSAVATVVINLKHEIIHWNKAMENLTGIKAADVLGTSDQWKPFYDHKRPCALDLIIENEIGGKKGREAYIKYCKEYCNSVLIKNGFHAERSYPHLGGKARYVAFDAAPIYGANGKIIAAVETLHDMTERKKAENKLLENEKFIESLVQNSALATIVVDLQHKVIFWNKACEELTGTKAVDMIGTSDQWKPFYDHKRPGALDLIIENEIGGKKGREEYRKHCKEYCISDNVKNGFHAERSYPHLGGKARYVAFDAAPIYGANGKIIAAMETLQDITERKKAEEKLAEKDKFIESLIQSSAVATFVVDSQHKVIFWNKACEELTGTKAADVLGTSNQWKPFYDEQIPCAADLVIYSETGTEKGYEKYYEGYSNSILIKKGLHTERSYPNLGGRFRYLAFDAAPIYNANGEIVAAVETLHDITVLKKAQQKMLEIVKTKSELESTEREKNYINSIIEALPLSLIVVNPDGSIRLVNPRTCELLGYSANDLVGGAFEKVLGVSVKKSIFRTKELMKIHDKEVMKDERMKYATKNGEEIPVAVSGCIMRDKNRKLKYIVIAAKDLREINKYAAERLSKLTPVLQKAAMGDFSKNIKIPEKEDEFTEHLVALNLMIDDLKESMSKNIQLVKDLEKQKASLEQKIEERTANLDFANKQLIASNKKLEETQEQLLDQVNELELFNKMTMGREAKILELKEEVVLLKEWQKK